LYVAQNRIRRWLKPGEDRQAMIDTFGGEIELSKFLWKRANDELLSKLTVTKSENKEEETGE
jgi:menaquinone-dependent protoporphyrinogen IX oxidase